MKTFIKSALIVIAFGSFAGIAGAQSTCPSIAPYQCSNGTCVNEAALCNRTGMGGLAGSTSTSGSTGGAGDLLNTNLSEKCTGNLRYDEAATAKCAALAEQQGKALGYDITCTTESRESVRAVNANPVGTETMYFATCKINGSPDGYDPVSLVGYQGSGQGIQVWDNFFGQTTVYGSGYNVNSMWYALPCGLADAASGKSGALQGAVTCTKGAQEFFGSSNPADWRVDTYSQSRGRASATVTTGTGKVSFPLQTSTRTTTGVGVVDDVFNSYALTVVKQMIEKARALYGTAAILQDTQDRNNATNNGTTGSTQNIPTDSRFTVTSDKASYCVGDTPLFTVKGGKDIVGYKVLWSSAINGVATVEYDSDYGHVMSQDGTGSKWSDYGGTWNSTQIGKWTKTANVGGMLNTISFEVKDCGVPQTGALACFPKTVRAYKYGIASFSATNGVSTFSSTYDWQAPGATKDNGQGRDFSTTYLKPGTYTVSVKSGAQTDTCQVTVVN